MNNPKDIRPFAAEAGGIDDILGRLNPFAPGALTSAAGAGALGGLKNPFGPSAEQEQKVRDLAAGWDELEARMRASPTIARDIGRQHDAWVAFYAKWQAGDKNTGAINTYVNELHTARAIALHAYVQDVPNKLPPVQDSAARRVAEWINQNAPTFRQVSAILSEAFPNKPQWLFSDPDPSAAARLALDPAWPVAQRERQRAIRTLMAQTGWTVDALRNDGIRKLPDGIPVFGTDERPKYPTPEHNYAASTLARTWMLFPPPGQYVIQTTVTNGGDPAQRIPQATPDTITLGGNDTAFVQFLIPIAAFLARAAFAYAVVCIVEMAGTMIDRQLARGSDTAKMVNIHKAALAMIGDHAKREQDAGHAIPFTEEENRLLNTLLEAQKIIAAKTEQPLPNPFGGALTSVASSGAKAVEHLAETPGKIAEAVPFVAIAAVVGGIAYLGMNRGGH